MSFRLTPRSMTLDDLELLLSFNFQRISRHFAGFGRNNNRTNEDRPVLSATTL